jgi:hypothetical protein
VTVAPSGLATQPIGEAAPVMEGIWQLELPVPFPLRFLDGRIGELMFHHEERLETMPLETAARTKFRRSCSAAP